MIFLNLLLCSAAALPWTTAAEDSLWTNYKTEPSFDFKRLNITKITDDRSLLAPGHYFIANDRGPQIYDKDLKLVWNIPVRKNYRIQDFHICDYLGSLQNHLCWHENSLQGKVNIVWGRQVIYNDNYQQVGRNFTVGVEGYTPNLHGFHMLPGGFSFLQPVYVPRRWDLQPYAGKKNGWIWDSCFQEIGVKGAFKRFTWCATDHVPLWETAAFFTQTKNDNMHAQPNASSPVSGRGTQSYPFDFFHLNAIDKNDEGDYFVSGRHFNQILKIAGPKAQEVHGVKPGSMIWRLNGRGGNIELDGFKFSRQHGIREISTSVNETVLSLFDNGWDGYTKGTSPSSRGRIISVNNETMTAKCLAEYPHPYGGRSRAQGFMHVQPNGNALVGWGIKPQLTEYTHNGTVLLHAHFESGEYHSNSYRAFKAIWKGHPTTSPKILAYQGTCDKDSELYTYVSWNGATEVHRWRFYTAVHLQGPWVPGGTHHKTDFETSAILSNAKWVSPFVPYVMVEALDVHGAVLGTATTRTWVPDDNIKKTKKCDTRGCEAHFAYLQKFSRAAQCDARNRPALAALLMLVLLVESVVYAANMVSAWTLAKLRIKAQDGGFVSNGQYASLDSVTTVVTAIKEGVMKEAPIKDG